MSANEDKQTESLGTEFPREQARCRELLVAYREIGPAGAFGEAAIQQVLLRADEAAVSGDIVEMLRVFKEMQGCI